MTPAERHFYDAHRYGETARRVDLALLLDSRPCAGGHCDEHRCPRHARTAQVVDRYLRLLGRRDTDPTELSMFDADRDTRESEGP
jgi:hypothetical protein